MSKIIYCIIFFIIPFLLSVLEHLSILPTLPVMIIEKHAIDWISLLLTVGSILFTIHTFIIPYAKQYVYDSEKYISFLQAEFSGKWKVEQYRPLRNLAMFLFITITSSFLSSVCVLLVLCFQTHFAIPYIACYFALISLLGLFMSLILSKRTFDFMLK